MESHNVNGSKQVVVILITYRNLERSLTQTNVPQNQMFETNVPREINRGQPIFPFFSNNGFIINKKKAAEYQQKQKE